MAISQEVVNDLAVVWIIWVSGICALITFVFGKQRKEVNAAFNKIRQLEKSAKVETKKDD